MVLQANVEYLYLSLVSENFCKFCEYFLALFNHVPYISFVDDSILCKRKCSLYCLYLSALLDTDQKQRRI